MASLYLAQLTKYFWRTWRAPDVFVDKQNIDEKYKHVPSESEIIILCAECINNYFDNQCSWKTVYAVWFVEYLVESIPQWLLYY